MRERRLDPVTFEVIWHRLLDATEEMGIKYMRTSGSPVLVGAYDAATAVMLPDGQLVAMGPYITTQGHGLRLIVESVRKTRARRPGIGEGDMFICNDPYLGATHQPDVATVAPFHFGGDLRAWVGASGHWLDIGGPEPGGFNMNARTVFEEGLRMPPLRIVDGGVVREDLVETILNQVREPLVELDLRGQMVANEAGKERLAALFDEHGLEVVEQAMREGIDHVERRLRDRIRRLADGVWREIQFLDHDGHQRNVRKIICTLTKSGDKLRLDFTGSDPEVESFANCTYGGLRAASLSALCILLAYDVAWNDGVARCVDIVAPPGTIVTAQYPTPVSQATISAIIVTLNLVFGAVSRMLLASPEYHEEAMANWCGTSLAVSITGRNHRGVMTVLPESSHFAAGCGARTLADGVDTGGIIINTTANIPSVEATEAEYPVLYLFRRQMTNSGGAGRFRGGVSGEVALVPYDASGPVESSFSGVGAVIPNAYGLAGGLPGACARYLRFPQADVLEDGPTRNLPATLEQIPGQRVVTELNHSHAPFPPGSVEYHNWQGGGGYGDPLERPSELVIRDVIAGTVSTEVAHRSYGVVIRAGEVDAGETQKLRENLQRHRLERARPAKKVLEAEDTRTARSEEGMPGDVPPEKGVERRGELRYGDVVVFDFQRDAARCLKCDYRLGDATADFRLGCLVEETDPAQAGPARGQEYATGEVVLRRFYCPHCARQLETEVTVHGAPRAYFRLL